MSLRTRWAATLAVLAAVAVGFGVTGSLVVIENQLRSQVDADLTDRVTALPEDLRGLLGQSFHRFGGRRGAVELDAVVQVVTAQGVRFGFEDAPVLPVDDDDLTLAVADAAPQIRTVEVDSVPYRMITAHLEGTRLGGAVQIGVDISGIDHAVAALRRRMVVVWMVASGLAGLAGWFTARRAVVPIERLTATAELVAATERLDVDLDTEAPAEIGRLATSFAAMLGALRRSREQQQQLASDAGHELRTPLTALRTNLETLRRRLGDLSAEQRTELLDAALTEVGELSTLSAELVDLASDTGGSEEAIQAVDLSDLVDNVVDRFRRRIDQRIQVSGDGVEVEVRPLQIERAISNLIDNAHKWGPHDTPIEVVVEGRSITVRDHGPGIPESDLPHIFDRFYRSVAARTTPGSGLGLAIVDSIVQGHGGRVTAANHPNGGAMVGFSV